MQKAIDEFRTNVLRVHNLGGLYQALLILTTSAVDASDILRAQMVLGVSALDCYVHEVTRLGMIEVFERKRVATPKFSKFPVCAGILLSSSSKSLAAFETEIRERHSFLTFQHPDKIADAIRLFSDVDLWEEVSSAIGTPKQDIKNQLKFIIDRRNKIAHEADMDPSYPNTRWPIVEADVQRTLKFIEELCEAIHIVVT